MPKIIKDARISIINCAKEHLLVNHEENISLRQIAKECGIAVGTIYNYFPDKMHLLVAVMVSDWERMLEELDAHIRTCSDLQEGFFHIYDTVASFKDLYGTVYQSFASGSGIHGTNGNRHRQLRTELEHRVLILLERFASPEDYEISCLLTETILVCAVQEDLNKEMLWAYVRRLF